MIVKKQKSMKYKSTKAPCIVQDVVPDPLPPEPLPPKKLLLTEKQTAQMAMINKLLFQ